MGNTVSLLPCVADCCMLYTVRIFPSKFTINTNYERLSVEMSSTMYPYFTITSLVAVGLMSWVFKNPIFLHKTYKA